MRDEALTREPHVWDAAAEILAILKCLDPAPRLQALALAAKVWVETDGTLEVPRG